MEAERELRAALDAYGATSMSRWAEGDVSPSALWAIAASIRLLGGIGDSSMTASDSRPPGGVMKRRT